MKQDNIYYFQIANYDNNYYLPLHEKIDAFMNKIKNIYDKSDVYEEYKKKSNAQDDTSIQTILETLFYIDNKKNNFSNHCENNRVKKMRESVTRRLNA